MNDNAEIKMRKAVVDKIGKQVSIITAEYEKDLNAWSVYSDSEIYFVVRGLIIYFFTRKEEE